MAGPVPVLVMHNPQYAVLRNDKDGTRPTEELISGPPGLIRMVSNYPLTNLVRCLKKLQFELISMVTIYYKKLPVARFSHRIGKMPQLGGEPPVSHYPVGHPTLPTSPPNSWASVLSSSDWMLVPQGRAQVVTVSRYWLMLFSMSLILSVVPKRKDGFLSSIPILDNERDSSGVGYPLPSCC